MFYHPDSNQVIPDINYRKGEHHFQLLIHMEDLDRRIAENDSIIEPFEEILEMGLSEFFNEGFAPTGPQLFLQRILYHINRLKLFWYDDLKNYINETSPYLFSVQSRIELAWQEWELSHFDLESLKKTPVKETLHEWVVNDLSPELTEADQYFRDQMTEVGYKRLLGIISLDGLVEASQLSRVLGGVGNEVQSMLTRILFEEYGCGRLAKKHSSFFTTMLNTLGLKTQPEAYLDLSPWEVIANTNNSFFLCERKRNFLRYIGGLLYTEVSVPAAFTNYLQAGKRLGLSKEATDYWEVHIKEDQYHGRWMLENVALPLTDQYHEVAWEILWGYDQQRFISTRASQAIFRSLRGTN